MVTVTTKPTAIDLAVAIIKRFEGCAKRMPDGRLRAYPDPGTGGAPWTIGWGSTGKDIAPGTIWTQEQADARLAQEVAEKAAGVDRLVSIPLADHERAALISFAYNLGVSALGGSTLLRLLNAGASRESVAEQFSRWNKAAGKVLDGLTARRAAEKALFLGQNG